MMRRPVVTVLCEDRLHRTKGSIYSVRGFCAEHWEPYLEAFGKLDIVARVEEHASILAAAAPVEHPRIRVRRVTPFQGPIRLLPKLPSVLSEVRKAMAEADAVIVRWPGTLSLVSAGFLLSSGKPIAIEVVGDAQAVYSAGVGGAASGLLHRLSERVGDRLFDAASAITYVTEHYLQAVRPPPPTALTAAFSDVRLSDTDLRCEPRSADLFCRPTPTLLFAGTLEQNYKGLDTLLDALVLLKEQGHTVSLRVAGSGRFEPLVLKQIRCRQLSTHVVMLGQLNRDALMREMDRCDILVLPSRTEGLPRTIIEAMARGTPVVATAVGGIPELLPSEDLVEPGNPQALAAELAICIQEPARLARMSARNLRRARAYVRSAVGPVRRDFYRRFGSLIEARRERRVS